MAGKRRGAVGVGLMMAASALYGGLAMLDEQKRRRLAGIAARPARPKVLANPAEPPPVPPRAGKTPPRGRATPIPGEAEDPPPQAPVFESPARARARGRYAPAPWRIPLKGWRHILGRVWTEMGRDNLSLIAAGVAFYALLAIFPAIAVAVAVAGLYTQPSDVAGAINAVSELFPTEAAQILTDQASQVAGSREGGLGLAALTGLVVAMYSSSRGVMSLMQGLNVVYDEREKRNILMLNVTALILTVVVIVGAVLGLTATIVIPAVLGIVGIKAGWLGWLSILRWPILLVGTVVGLSILYRFGPSRSGARWTWLSTGAIVACGLWLAGTAGFAWYAGNFASYNQTFGTLGGAIVLLMWLWLSAYIVLIGAELNAEIEAQTSLDSTVGPAEPMGQRGAVKADMLGEPTD